MRVRELRGIISPMVTPFDANEDIDFQAFRSEVDFLLSQGVDGLCIGGSTGEGAVLSDSELQDLISAAVEIAERSVPILAGVIRNSTREAIEASRRVCEAGADVLLVTPTFYHGATPKGNYEYFSAIGDEIGLPIMVYNVVPTNQVQPDEMQQLSEIEQVIGIKQVDAEKVSAMVSLGEDTQVFSACDDMLYPTYVSGACGSIAAISTAVPQLCVDQWHAYLDGDQTKAQDIHRRLSFVFQAYHARPFPGKIKKVIELLGRQVGRARAPISESSAEEVADMRRWLRRAGLHTN